jgi:hypothetical protein
MSILIFWMVTQNSRTETKIKVEAYVRVLSVNLVTDQTAQIVLQYAAALMQTRR